jgi:hypothetical protein
VKIFPSQESHFHLIPSFSLLSLTMADSQDTSAEASVVNSNKQDENGSALYAPTENNIGLPQGDPAARKPSRHVSEWEALQIAQAGDLATINAEVDEIEAELQLLNLRSTWYKPLLKFKNPKTFNYLLVGKSCAIM